MSDFLSIGVNDDSRSMPSTKRFGERAEEIAINYLTELGLRIVVTNFTVPVGRNSRGALRTGEIDIIALDREVLCFIEVKARRNVDFAPATANIDRRKQRQIVRTARAYRRIFNVRGMPYRYDAVTVVWPKYAEPAVEYLKEYWNEDVFKKKRWHDDQMNAIF